MKENEEVQVDEGIKAVEKALIEDEDQLHWRQNPPWLDIRLPEVAVKHLWDIINDPEPPSFLLPIRPRPSYPKDEGIGESAYAASQLLAGRHSKTQYVQDKNNLFFKNVLKEWTEFMFFKDWNNYYECVVTKSKPMPVFELFELWVNYQKQHEFNPPHHHSGLFSFVVFMKIPTHWKEQHALPFSLYSGQASASDFQFLINEDDNSKQVQTINIPLCSEDEGRMLFFPAWLTHQVFPFYECDKERITLSGNIILHQKQKEEQQLELEE